LQSAAGTETETAAKKPT